MEKSSTPSPIYLFNNDAVYEILTWSPAKSLMRFKAINKFWSTIIAHDSFFRHLHRRRSGDRIGGEKLVFRLSRRFLPYNWEHHFISIDHTDGRNHTREYTHHNPNELVEVLVDDGFACFYSMTNSTISASLHNLSTHESTDLPKDSNFHKGLLKRSFISFGFDSLHTICKILHRSSLIDLNIAEAGFEVYTVGDAKNSWRMINSPLCNYCECNHSSICINGVIYWLSSCTGKNKCYRGSKITAFDVSDESFHLISVPHNCDTQPLRNVNGVPALMEDSPFSSLVYLKMWKLVDYKNQIWVDEKILIDIAPRLSCWICPNLIGTIGKDEILVIHYLDGIEVLIYYDRARRMSKAVELKKMLPPDGHLANILQGYIYMENIMPLRSVSN